MEIILLGAAQCFSCVKVIKLPEVQKEREKFPISG